MSINEPSSTIDPNLWLEKYGDLMYKYTIPRVNDEEMAEDLVQETFLSALKGLANFKGEASEKNWLFAILKNKIIDHYRKKATDQTVSETMDLGTNKDEWFNEDGDWAENKAPKDWHTKENRIDQKDFQNMINRCKDRLKDLQQKVFILKYMEDLDSEQICKVLNISPSNYWVLIHRARLQMRDCIEHNWIKQ